MSNILNIGMFVRYMLSISLATLITGAPAFGEDFQKSVPINLLLNNKYSLSATLHEAREIEADGAPAQIRSARLFILDEAGKNRVYQGVYAAGEGDLGDCVINPAKPTAIIEFDFNSERIVSAEVAIATIDSFGDFSGFQSLVLEGQLGEPLRGNFASGIHVPSGFRVRGGVYITVIGLITSDGEIWEGNPVSILQPHDGVIPSRGIISGTSMWKPRFCKYTIEGENDKKLSTEHSGDLLIELDRLVAKFGAQNVREAMENY